MNSAVAPHISQQAFDSAAEWWLNLERHPGHSDSHEFLNWVAKPENRAAFEFVKATMATIRDERSTPTLLKMRTAALSRLERTGTARWYGRRDILVGGAGAAAAVIVFGLNALRGQNEVSNYSTKISERRSFKLLDGSQVTLDANSEISAGFSADTRSVVLHRGRARFDVVHNENRPFEVTSGNETVVALGTSFNVEKLTKKVVITLIDGRVLVQNDAREAEKKNGGHLLTSLSPGDQMVAASDGSSVVRRINLQSETAWEEGRLVFRGQPLAEAVEQINRYTDRGIEVDASVAAVRISGVFNAGDVTAFVTAVTAYLPVTATMKPVGTIVLSQRA